MPGPNQGTNGSADERTPLTGSNSHSGSQPLYKDDRAWVRYPMSFFHLAWLTLASNYVNILLVFVPVGIVLGATGANPTTVFIGVSAELRYRGAERKARSDHWWPAECEFRQCGRVDCKFSGEAVRNVLAK
jgi:hypothetical protein